MRKASQKRIAQYLLSVCLGGGDFLPVWAGLDVFRAGGFFAPGSLRAATVL